MECEPARSGARGTLREANPFSGTSSGFWLVEAASRPSAKNSSERLREVLISKDKTLGPVLAKLNNPRQVQRPLAPEAMKLLPSSGLAGVGVRHKARPVGRAQDERSAERIGTPAEQHVLVSFDRIRLSVEVS